MKIEGIVKEGLIKLLLQVSWPIS